MRRTGIAARFALLVLGATSLIFVGILGYNYYSVKSTLTARVQADMQNLTRATIFKIEATLRGVEKVPLNLAAMIGKHAYSSEMLKTLAQDAVSNNKEIFGVAIAFGEGSFAERPLFAPYAYRDGKETLLKDFADVDAHYVGLDWYQIATELKRPLWSEPYFDEGGGDILMATYSAPFFDQTGAATGVVTADLALAWLRALVDSVRIYDTGYAFLLSQNGAFITAPSSVGPSTDAAGTVNGRRPDELLMRESIFSVAEARGDTLLRQIGMRMVRGAEGFEEVEDFISGRPSLLYFAPLSTSGWSLGVVFPQQEVFADIRRLSVRLLIIGLLGVALLTAAVVAISGSVARPLTVLAARSADIAQGNLEIELPAVTTRDEVGELARSFQEMQLALKDYIANLAQATAARERIESELKIASTIQSSFLPKRFPPFPQKDAMEIFAALRPAKMVGGDLYDFFLVGEDRLFVAIGDVSGKGVPAALFMAVTKTLLKGSAQLNLDPASVLSRVNEELCADNASAMFTTAICGFLDLRHGEFTYANGGHNPALLLGAQGTLDWLAQGDSAPLGCFEETPYKNRTAQLAAGDSLLLYTDGVTEAANALGNFFGEHRLLAAAGTCREYTAQRLVEEVLRSLDRFSEGAEQFDDVTLLALRYKGVSS